MECLRNMLGRMRMTGALKEEEYENWNFMESTAVFSELYHEVWIWKSVLKNRKISLVVLDRMFYGVNTTRDLNANTELQLPIADYF